MFARACRDLRAAEHPGDFLDTTRVIEHLNLGARRAFHDTLRHAQLMVGLASHLRQVRDTEHLSVGGERSQLAPHHFRHRAADPCVHFVEDEAGQVSGFDRSDLQCEADP